MPKALIIGAGIGCLAAGISLRKAAWEVEIFERALRTGTGILDDSPIG